MRSAAVKVVGKVLVLALTLSSLEARAQAPSATTTTTADAHEAARKLSAQALKLYDLGEFALALELFEKADALYPAPSYRVYTARAYAKLGKVRKALARYDEAIQMTRPTPAPAGFVEAQQTAAEERAETEKRLAVLRVDITGARAEEVTLTIDGEAVSAQGRLRVELDSGRHQIVAKAPKFLQRSESVELREGQSSTVQLKLESSEVASPPFRPLAIAAGALGGAGLIVAVATSVVLADKHSAVLRECPNQLCSPAGRDLINSVPPLNAVNLGGFIAAGVGGAAAAVFLGLHLREPKPTTAIAPAPLPGGGGLWITRSF